MHVTLSHARALYIACVAAYSLVRSRAQHKLFTFVSLRESIHLLLTCHVPSFADTRAHLLDHVYFDLVAELVALSGVTGLAPGRALLAMARTRISDAAAADYHGPYPRLAESLRTCGTGWLSAPSITLLFSFSFVMFFMVAIASPWHFQNTNTLKSTNSEQKRNCTFHANSSVMFQSPIVAQLGALCVPEAHELLHSRAFRCSRPYWL